MKVIVQNLAVEYRDEGSGTPVLFLHGWGDTLETFNTLSRSLSKNRRVVRVDLPGFGGSESPRNTWDVSAYIEFVSNFIRKLDINPDIIVGHSFGGRIILKGVSSGIFNPRKIILIASAGVSERRTAKNIFIRSGARLLKVLLYIPPFVFWKNHIRNIFYKKLGSDYNTFDHLKDTFVKVIEEDLRVYVSHINIPTLIIWGSEDEATPLADGRLLHELIKKSELHVIDKAGHFVHKDNPDQVLEYIQNFL